MVHIRDVWINWFEGEENGYNVCEFHEWRSEDRIEVLDQAAVVKVTDALYDYIENNICDLPEQLLNDVYRKSYLRKNMSRIELDYCFIATNGEGIIAVDTLGYKTPIRKSRLTPRQEQIVFELLENEGFTPYDVESSVEKKEYHILSPHPDLMKGLTRKERQLKQLLFMALDQLYSSKNAAEIRYWYTEWSPHHYLDIQMMDMEEAWQSLYHEIKDGWTSNHYHLCEAIVKGQPFFEKLWEIEHGESVK
ncbi:YjbA family protein [Desertibacillus haloalkaliphilus]|uniref:YjbA family protein n=1 Tax=Desertibacillus haloalkaliphilus TaxID=1328930 RepID=UPI001C25CE0E|nr:YjbA family protein [Desertibacillus haloalkaliphilus]MBU8906926.1 YjbA family protein [Desertibacillus haloalkaliphilus]